MHDLVVRDLEQARNRTLGLTDLNDSTLVTRAQRTRNAAASSRASPITTTWAGPTLPTITSSTWPTAW
jgi:hypothetical protein